MGRVYKLRVGAMKSIADKQIDLTDQCCKRLAYKMSYTCASPKKKTNQVRCNAKLRPNPFRK